MKKNEVCTAKFAEDRKCGEKVNDNQKSNICRCKRNGFLSLSLLAGNVSRFDFG